MTEAPNGLASLTQARDRRVRRTMPPPRHPVATTPSIITNDDQGTPSQPSMGEGQSARPEPAEKSVSAAPLTHQPGSIDSSVSTGSRAQRRRRAPEPATIEPTVTPIKPVTVYVSDVQSDFLEQVRIAGLMDRVDISRSAVVRLALSRLQRDMSVDEIKQHLISQPTDPNRTGRKRR